MLLEKCSRGTHVTKDKFGIAFKKQGINNMTSKPFVSVVVPAYNEAYVLADCLIALQDQDYDGPYEIVVVNNASTDYTPEIARAMGIKVVDESRKGYIHALRDGFATARGEIIACTDADTVVPPDWLSRLVAILTGRPNAIAASGIFALLDGSPWLRLLGWTFGRLNWHLAGGNMAIWRWVYETVGGFNPAVNLGADTELGLRLRPLGLVIINRGLVVHTSARRFQTAFWQTLWLYGINDMWLILFGQPRFYAFPDIRIPASQAFGPMLVHGRSDQKVVALTFDDGPSSYTAKVLDILARYQVKATFFVIGQNVKRYPDLGCRIVAEGHAIGNHTYDHPLLAPVETSQRLERELDSAAAVIQATTGQAPVLFRPPHGWCSPWMINLACRKGYVVVTWNISADDWRQPHPKVIAERVLRQVKPGAIILLHDGLETSADPPVQKTVSALPDIIEALKAVGTDLSPSPN